MSRKLRYLFALLAVLVLVLSACKSAAPTEEAAVTEPDAAETDAAETEPEPEPEEAPSGRCAPMSADEVDVIKIGVPLPMSAPGAVAGGLAMQYAINIAVDEINAAGGVLGKPIQPIFYDTQSLPERGTAAMEYLITQECVVAVVGEYHSSAGVAENEVAHKYHIPTVFAETWNDDITGAQYEETFRIAPASSMVAAADVNYISNLEGIEFVVIVTENTDYGLPAAEQTKEALAEIGIESEIYSADKGVADYSAIITRIQGGPTPDIVMTLITGEDSYNFENQAIEAGLMPTEDTICMANQVAVQPAFWDAVPGGNYCLFRKVGLTPAAANDVTRAFAEKYKQRFNIFPESYALEAYDAMRIMALAIENAGSLDPDAIIDALEATDVDLAQGHYYFPYGKNNPVPEGEPEWMWHQWPDPAVLFLQYYEEGQSSDDAAVVYPEAYQTHGTFLIKFGETP
ncbi:MAG TPA: ABC transporter substrate-binding protein [Anaerolineales bacterium]|nr:ABC transporter substrate-binding protein [Anaerolineales bacterium]